jgi:hypothetical protein
MPMLRSESCQSPRLKTLPTAPGFFLHLIKTFLADASDASDFSLAGHGLTFLLAAMWR